MESKVQDGPISLSLLSLQAQVQTLLKEAGGEQTLELLDALCRVRPKEQAIVLSLFTRIIDRIASGEIRLSEEQSELEAFEDALYHDLVTAIEDLEASKSPMKLEVLQGGRETKDQTVVKIDDLRKARKQGKRTLLN